jgi:hypothetical protein
MPAGTLILAYANPFDKNHVLKNSAPVRVVSKNYLYFRLLLSKPGDFEGNSIESAKMLWKDKP